MSIQVDQFAFAVQTNQPRGAESENNTHNNEQLLQQSEEYSLRNRAREMKWLEMFHR